MKKIPTPEQENPSTEKSEEKEARNMLADRLENQTATYFSWETDEYKQPERGKRWYIFAGLIILLTIGVSILTDNWTMALAIVVFAGVYEYIQRHHPPKKIQIALTDIGIQVGHMFFPYSHIEAFWIHYNPRVQTLNLSIHNRRHSNIVIQLEDQDISDIRDFMLTQVPEWEGKHEPLSEVIVRLLKLS